jgi:putative membrane protein
MPSDALVLSGPDLARTQRLHPLSPVFDLISLVRQLVPAVVGASVSGVAALIPLGVVLLVAGRYLVWWRKTWSFDGAVFRMDSGVLARREIRIPAARIQQVELVRGLRHRMLGLATIEVETAGGAGRSEIDLEVVRLDVAMALRDALVRARDAARGDPPVSTAGQPAAPVASAPPSTDEVLVRLSTARLAVAGITGPQVFVLLPAAGWLFQAVDDLPDRIAGLMRQGELESAGPVALAAAVVIGILAWFAVAATASIVANHGFTVCRRGDDVVLARGLFSRRESTVPLRRVQAVRVDQSILRRALGMVALRVQSAGQGGSEAEVALRGVVPLLTPVEAASLVTTMVGSGGQLGPLVPAPAAARRRALVRRVVPAVVVTAPLVVVAWPWGLFLLVTAVALAVASGIDAYRGLGYRWDKGILVARQGSLARRTVVVAAVKAQSTRVRSSPFQRRVGLVTLAVDVAGGTAPEVVDQPTEVAEDLAARTLATAQAG